MANNRGCMREEILFDIFTRLPVKSLCRFKCVSTFWLSIISDPVFVAAHLERSISRPKLLISVQYLDHQLNKGTCAFFSIDYPHQDSSAQPLHATSHSSTELNHISMISLSPSGLVCFTNSGVIKIGNPITGDFDILPYGLSDPIRSFKTLFFGFDPIEKSHVILKLERRDYTENNDPDVPDFGRSDVYDMMEKCWHDSQPHPWLEVSGDGSSICINGVIYFTANSDEIDECLYAYDVRLKSFQMIERPVDSLSAHGRRFVVELLIDYNGRVAFVGDGDLEENIEDEIKMWILEDTENHTWSFKSFVVPWRENLTGDGFSVDSLESLDSNLERKVAVFGGTHRGELILATSLWNNSPYLFFYEIETNTLRRFQVDGFGNTPRGIVGINLVIESLQSPINVVHPQPSLLCM